MSETRPAPGAPEGEGRCWRGECRTGCYYPEACGMTAAPSPDPVRRELREAADECCRPCSWPDTDCYVNGPRAAALPAAPGIEGPGEGREDELRAAGHALRMAIITETYCPTDCDADCEAACHESHRVMAKRWHQPEDCRSVIRAPLLDAAGDYLTVTARRSALSPRPQSEANDASSLPGEPDATP